VTRNMTRTREAWITAMALFIAVRTLEAGQDPAADDTIEDMRTLLAESYPTHAAQLEEMAKRVRPRPPELT